MAIFDKKTSHYEKTPFLDWAEKECCCAEKPPVDGGTEDDCLEIWKKELQLAKNELNEAVAKFTKAQSIYNNAYAWERKLKTWVESAKTIHEKAVITYAELALFIEAIQTLEGNSHKTIRALKALICLVKKIFDNISRLCIEWEGDDCSNLIYELKDFIKCNPGLDEQKKQQAIVCIELYETKVKEVYALRTAVLNKILEQMHCATVVAAYISNEERNFGLKWQVNDLRKRLIQDTTSLDKMNECFCPPADLPDLAHPCGAEKTKSLFPIMAMAGKEDSTYYKKLSRLYQEAEDASKDYHQEMQEARGKWDKISARKTSLESAITAAELAEKA